MNGAALDIRTAVLEDVPQVSRFLDRAYPDIALVKQQRLYTQYLENPFRPQGRELPIALALDGPEVIGQLCASYVPLMTAKGSTTGFWGTDSFVLAEYRGKGIGQKLQKTLRSKNQYWLSLWMGAASEHIKQKMGFRHVADVSCFFRPADTTSKLSPDEHFVCGKRLPLAGIEGVTIERIFSFTGEFDELWQKIRPALRGSVERSSLYLNWKFLRQPSPAVLSFAVRRGDQLAAYLVLRRCTAPERDHGAILDLVSPPDQPQLHRALVQFGSDFLGSLGAKGIEAASAWDLFSSVYSELGFLSVSSLPLYATPEYLDALGPSGGWLFTRSDSDWDQYPAGFSKDDLSQAS